MRAPAARYEAFEADREVGQTPWWRSWWRACETGGVDVVVIRARHACKSPTRGSTGAWEMVDAK